MRQVVTITLYLGGSGVNVIFTKKNRNYYLFLDIIEDVTNMIESHTIENVYHPETLQREYIKVTKNPITFTVRNVNSARKFYDELMTLCGFKEIVPKKKK